ncbi:PLP-dependent aminotransferase family protein [Actinocrinis puniceicyclus]|uniref:PLP-dependent aminotransferase family protein n=1 Tax=Actinocrinis puniceicyclus TaxID=977794 RepID=A0A8J8BDY6_9ACTN|nr:PLP-dependent aminotransferase family protein [Actinocrinis puniceicyclus]MBS2964656.1 PLP-dependent aminotransferase family protein [Actinocrinis puniceicyclus]
MPAVTTTVGAGQLAQRLGPWRSADGHAAGRVGGRPLQAALAERLTGLVLDGRLALGTRLPAERTLSAALGVSRTTVTAAYALLRESGFAVSRQGSGSYVSVPDGAARNNSGWRADGRDGDVIDLMFAAPLAPLSVLRRALRTAAEQFPAHADAGGYLPYGLDALREAVADNYTARGLPTSPDQILVTNGAQGAITLVARLLCGAGDRVLVESPTYPNALDTFRNAHARAIPVPLDDGGWVPGGYENALAQLRPRLAYLIPHFQNPTGYLMDPDTQGSIARAARRAGSWLLADETITEAALDTAVPPPFVATIRPADAEAVLVCGSMAKSFWGGLRIGWLRAPARIVHELAAARAAMDLGSPVLDQLAAAAVLRGEQGYLEEHRHAWREQRAALMQAIDETFPQWSYRVPEGGLCLWLRMDREEATALSQRAQTHGLLLHAGPRFGADPGTFERYIRLPYVQPPDLLREAVRRLDLARAVPGPRHAADHRADLVA